MFKFAEEKKNTGQTKIYFLMVLLLPKPTFLISITTFSEALQDVGYEIETSQV